MPALDPAELVDLDRYSITQTRSRFEGRHSIHRVSPVRGDVPRCVALLAYDTKPDADSSDLFKLVRYGRSTTLPAGEGPEAS